MDKLRDSSIFTLKRHEVHAKPQKFDQFTGQVAQSRAAYPNFAPLKVNPRIGNYSTLEPFGINFLFLAALCYELNC